MGLSIYLHVNCHAIDDERWEVAYLTSLQLLEQFPGPLAGRICEDVGRFHRLVVTKNIVHDVDLPEELLKTLCDSFITVPLYERQSLDLYQFPPDSLTNIEEMFGHLLLMMSGMPAAIDWYLDEEELLAEFVRRWPEREQELADTLRESLEKAESTREQMRQVTEQLDELAGELEGTEPVSAAPSDGGEVEPTAEFIRAEILRQRENVAELEDTVPELGRQMQTALRANDQLRTSLEGSDRRNTLDRIYQVSFRNGIELPEDIWQKIDGLQDLRVLRVLLLLMMCPEREMGFWRGRQQLLQSPDLWPLLTGRPP
ncbi:MAG: hypothetical protein ACQESR_08885 [Planctomycetota bacterium]